MSFSNDTNQCAGTQIEKYLRCPSCDVNVDVTQRENRIKFVNDNSDWEAVATKCTLCDKCIGVLVNGDFQSISDVLKCESRENDGWRKVDGDADQRALFTLSQIIYMEYEVPEESQLEAQFAVPPPTDLVKLLWINKSAVGFYSVKPKGMLDLKVMDIYRMPVLDTLFIRTSCRRQGHASSAVEDLLTEFPDQNIGFSFPVSTAMKKVIAKHLEQRPNNRPRFWEITGCGSEGNCRNLWITLRQLK